LVNPPTELQQLIFPWVENSIKLIQNLIQPKKIESEHSGLGFLKLLLLLRRVFLQDAAAFIWRVNIRNMLFFSCLPEK
jgi:hypothetical protein